jgi:serine/threonine protein kinase
VTTVPLADLPGFRIIGHAGQGGLGDVFIAERLSTGGKVAIKILRDTANAQDVERRIRREVAALLVLKGHPGVIQIEEVLSTRKGPALVMEYAEDGSLHSILQDRGSLTTTESIDVGIQVAQLLADAHPLGIVHRDIKPQNILRTGFGRYKVCDFGIAALTRGAESAEYTSAISYRYASPEELDGADVDGASDVYSLGVTLVQTRLGNIEGVRTGGVLSFATTSARDRSFADVLTTMTSTDPSARPGAALVVTQLRQISVLDDGPNDPQQDDETVRRPRRLEKPQPNAAGLPQPTSDKQWWV